MYQLSELVLGRRENKNFHNFPTVCSCIALEAFNSKNNSEMEDKDRLAFPNVLIDER